MKAYDEPRESKPENAPSANVTIAFDKAKAYDDMRESVIGLRNSAWALRHKGITSTKVTYHLTNALLTDDKEMLGLMQMPIVAVQYSIDPAND